MKKWLVGVIVLELVGAVALLSLGMNRASWSQTAAAAPAGTPIPAVTAGSQVVAEARVVPVQRAALSFPMSGTVAEVLAKEGDRVAAGQVLIRLDRTQQDATVAQADAEVRRAQAHVDELKAGPRPQEVQAAQAAFDGAVAQEEAVKLRMGPRSHDAAAAAADVRRLGAQLDLAQAGARPEAIAAADADLASAQAALSQAQLAAARTELRAPFAGVVGALDLKAGEIAAAGTPAAQLANLSTWQIETDNLSELNVVKIAEGASATISFDAVPGLKVNGTVTHIKAFGENKQGDMTYTVVVKPEHQDRRMHWNMTASVAIDSNGAGGGTN